MNLTAASSLTDSPLPSLADGGAGVLDVVDGQEGVGDLRLRVPGEWSLMCGPVVTDVRVGNHGCAGQWSLMCRPVVTDVRAGLH